MSRVRWVEETKPALCDECGALTIAGDKVALWIERFFTEYWGKARRCRRHYCRTCGKHLEDSLITTEASQ